MIKRRRTIAYHLLKVAAVAADRATGKHSDRYPHRGPQCHRPNSAHFERTAASYVQAENRECRHSRGRESEREPGCPTAFQPDPDSRCHICKPGKKIEPDDEADVVARSACCATVAKKHRSAGLDGQKPKHDRDNRAGTNSPPEHNPLFLHSQALGACLNCGDSAAK